MSRAIAYDRTGSVYSKYQFIQIKIDKLVISKLCKLLKRIIYARKRDLILGFQVVNFFYPSNKNFPPLNILNYLFLFM